jgi:hypothetical protein
LLSFHGEKKKWWLKVENCLPWIGYFPSAVGCVCVFYAFCARRLVQLSRCLGADFLAKLGISPSLKSFLLRQRFDREKLGPLDALPKLFD